MLREWRGLEVGDVIRHIVTAPAMQAPPAVCPRFAFHLVHLGVLLCRYVYHTYRAYIVCSNNFNGSRERFSFLSYMCEWW